MRQESLRPKPGIARFSFAAITSNRLKTVPRRFLEAINAKPFATKNSGRLELAEAMLHEDNPLTARVIVNRVWHHVFGRGLVATPDNFGKLGETPSHPELLDYLAKRFVAEAWSIKKLIREIALTRTFQLAATPTAKAREMDPDNRLLTSAHVRRLEAEAIRDAMLQVSGSLESQATWRLGKFRQQSPQSLYSHYSKPARSVPDGPWMRRCPPAQKVGAM